MQAQTEEECARLVTLLPSTESALLDWAINLMADVAQLETFNKMTARNVAMVFAPNMTQVSSNFLLSNKHMYSQCKRCILRNWKISRLSDILVKRDKKIITLGHGPPLLASTMFEKIVFEDRKSQVYLKFIFPKT